MMFRLVPIRVRQRHRREVISGHEVQAEDVGCVCVFRV